jgi:hypothetical protein
MFFKKMTSWVCAAVLAAVLGQTSVVKALDLDVDAEIVSGITLLMVDPLTFGLIEGGLAGSILIPSDGSASTNIGANTLGGLEQRGLITVNAPNASDVRVSMVNTSITNTTDTMPVDFPTCTADGNGTNSSTAGQCEFTMSGTSQDVGIGATLTVAGAESAGLYTGIMVVTANFFP